MRINLYVVVFIVYGGYHTQVTAKQRDAEYSISAITAQKNSARQYCTNKPIVPIAHQSSSATPAAFNSGKTVDACSGLQQEVIIKNTGAVEEEIPGYDDPNLLPYLIAIVGNFGKVLLDPTNTPNVIVCISHIIDNIIYVAREVTRASLTMHEKDRLISALHKEIKRVIVAYKYVQHRPIYKH